MIDWDGVNLVLCTLAALGWVAAIISWMAYTTLNYPEVTVAYLALWFSAVVLRAWLDASNG